MIRTIILGLVLLLSQENWSQQSLGFEILHELTSDAFKGRGYVGKGDSIAAQYLSEKFKEFGAQPLPGKSDFFQPFLLNVNTIPEECELLVNDRPLELAVDYLPQAMGGSEHSEFNLFIHITPKSLNKGIEELKKWRSTDALVLLDLDSCSNGDTVGLFHQMARQLAQKRPVIWVQHNKFTHTVSTSALPHAIVELKPMFLEDLRKIEFKITTEYITDYRTQNVLGMIPGRKKKDEYICISGHYDHLGMIGKDVIFPGANDNASGVAMLLNLMKYYRDHPPKYNIVFMAFAAEEAGILGSKLYTQEPVFPLEQIRFLINCDISGTGDEGITVVNGTLHKKRFKKLTKINRKKNYLEKIKIRGRAANSDHFWFSQKGVPCFFIYTMGGIKAYHDIYDKGSTLPLTEFDDYASLLKDFIRKL